MSVDKSTNLSFLFPDTPLLCFQIHFLLNIKFSALTASTVNGGKMSTQVIGGVI